MKPSWGPKWSHVGAMLAQKLIFGGSGTHKKTNMIFSTFVEPLGDDFGSIFGPKIDPKSLQNRSQERTSQKSKNVKKPLVFSMFLCPRWGQKSMKNRPKIVSKSILKEESKRAAKNGPKSAQHGSKIGPSWGHAGLQNRRGPAQERRKTTPKDNTQKHKPVLA